MESEYIVVGGGVIGLSVAYGLLKRGHAVLLVDDSDTAYRASRGNFGLVWVQSKGLDEPKYVHWTRRSTTIWRSFADTLLETTGVDVHLQQNGGLNFHLDEESLADRVGKYEKLRAELGGEYPYEVLDPAALKKEEPNIGPKVIAGVLHHWDGHVNSLLLMRALRIGIDLMKGQVRTNSRVETIAKEGGDFVLKLRDGATLRGEKVVLCTGLGTRELGPMLGFKAPVRPQRGQNLITEKIGPFLRHPAALVRQVNEGGIQIGDSHEDVGFDDSTTFDVAARLAGQAIDFFPALARVKLVRCWAALRVLSPDELPVYDQSTECPGAYVVYSHSGVTLAAAHAEILPGWIDGSDDIPLLETFSEKRFDKIQPVA